jgi:hypothetical protein
MSLLKTPLVPITIASNYKNSPLPARMALCTPDTRNAILGVVQDLRSLGHELRLSDLYRSYEMQRKANLDYVQHRKKAFSPPPGASMHEAGRAMDIDLSSIGVPLDRFWEISRARGFAPIIPKPIAGVSESWHFDFPGSHKAVYEYVKSGRSKSGAKPYAQMARSGILAIGVAVDYLADQRIGFLQSGLIRLGYDPGPVDGVLGSRTTDALKAAGCGEEQPELRLNELLEANFSSEYDEK